MDERYFQYLPHTLLRLEVQVAEHCNLNCRNCMHYSPIAEPEFLDLDQYKTDLARLTELFCGEMEWIRLMGGEPLLNPSIGEVMALTRGYFPYGHIYVVTNGILLPSMQEKFWTAARENNVEIQITKYPISIDFKEISKRAESNRVSIGYYGKGEERRPTMWRFPIDVRGDFDPNRQYYHCNKANKCLTLRSGRMYMCATSAHAHHLISYFGLSVSDSVRNGINIHEVQDAEELMSRLAKPKPFCRYCEHHAPEVYEDDWAVSKRDRYEWISFSFGREDIDYLRQAGKVYIYGAGSWGCKAFLRLKKNGVQIEAFLVTDKKEIPDSIDGVSVKGIAELNVIKKEDVCIIAINGDVKKQIQHSLCKKGFQRIIPIIRMDND